MSRTTILTAAALAISFAVPPALAQTSPPPPAPPTATTTAPPMPAPKLVHAAASTGKTRLSPGQTFTTVAAAQASCPTDTVVWSSLKKSHSFHMPNSKYYGRTKHGAYLCEHTALSAGFHQAKT